MSRIDWRADEGQVAGVEALPFGVLLFVVGALLVANAWAVIDTKMAAASAAREAARTFVEATDPGAAPDAALRAAREAIAAYGRNPERLTVVGADEPLSRCRRVTITVSYPVPVITLPLIGAFGDGLTVQASHSEIVDPFRDRVPGEATCGA